MRIVCLGGGPAGLYFSILAKKANPSWDITVVERNRPDDTFGWGVVFSDKTMDGFKDVDPETHSEITRRVPPLGRHRRLFQRAEINFRRPRFLRDRSNQTAANSSETRRRPRRKINFPDRSYRPRFIRR